MRKYIIIMVTSMVSLLLSGCSLFHFYDGRSQLETEQQENPVIWREVLQVQNTLWPLEKNVNKVEKNMSEMQKNMSEMQRSMNEIRDELATIKLSSIQAGKNMESLQAEIQRKTGEPVGKEKISAELQVEKKNKKEMQKTETTKAAGENKKVDPDIQSIIINDIQYHNVDTEDKVLIYVNAMNNPKVQTLGGENPRIVLDFLNARNIDKEHYEINTDGNFIRKIRIRSYREPMQKVRVVFDMMADRKYSVVQKFSKKENIYSFDIKPK